MTASRTPSLRLIEPAASERNRILQEERPLLLEGDANEALLDAYLPRARVFVLSRAASSEAADTRVEADVRAILLLDTLPDGNFEVLNLAVPARYRRRGCGRRMLDLVSERLHAEGSAGRTLTLGTGDAPGTLAFYRACGFVETGRVRDWFLTHYPEPVWEEGVRLRDQVRFERRI